jgi:hypothetical protein
LKAISRLGIEAQLEHCLFITEEQAHISACRRLGMTAIRFDPASIASGTGISDWSQAPQYVSDMLGQAGDINQVLTLRMAITAKYDIDNITIRKDPSTQQISASATKLYQLSDPGLGRLDGIFVRLPVELLVELDDTGHFQSAVLCPPNDTDKQEMIQYLKTLVTSGDIAINPGADPVHETHFIEHDSEGRRILKRRGFRSVY